MQKLDKNLGKINSTAYKNWIEDLENNNKIHPKSRTYYDDVAFDLFRVQRGVCAYTERFVCPAELYCDTMWVNGKYNSAYSAEYNRQDHACELEHFDSKIKDDKYWLWSNLFMIDSKINGIKTNTEVHHFLKPDGHDYDPFTYFDYDFDTNRYIPKTDLDSDLQEKIKFMIDKVLRLNHGVILNDRKDFLGRYINDNNKSAFKIDRFYTAIEFYKKLTPDAQ
jgi:hypothetical protein